MSEQTSVTHPAEHETPEVVNGGVEDEPTALEVRAEEEEDEVGGKGKRKALCFV